MTDYAAPLIGAAFPKAATDGPAFNAAIKAALSRYDLVRFERLLPQVATEANPLATDPAAVPSRMRGHVISLGGSVRDHVAALGRKVRKEVERCERHIASAGALRLNRAAGELRSPPPSSGSKPFSPRVGAARNGAIASISPPMAASTGP